MGLEPALPVAVAQRRGAGGEDEDRKSTRLNSSHSQISYAVFCLKKKKKITDCAIRQHSVPGHLGFAVVLLDERTDYTLAARVLTLMLHHAHVAVQDTLHHDPSQV